MQHVGHLGEDAAGDLVRSTFVAEGLDPAGVLMSPDRRTPVLIQTADGGDHGVAVRLPRVR